MRGSLICQHREAGHWGGGTGRFIMAAKSDRKISRVNQNADPRDERERRPKKALRRPGAEKPDFRYGPEELVFGCGLEYTQPVGLGDLAVARILALVALLALTSAAPAYWTPAQAGNTTCGGGRC